MRRFLGVGEAPASPEDLSKFVGTNASPTDDPRRRTIVQPMGAGSVRVGVTVRGAPEKLRWLERPADCDCDETAGTVSFRKDVAIDKATEFVFVQGIPRDRRVFLAHRKLEKRCEERIDFMAVTGRASPRRAASSHDGIVAGTP